MFCTSPATSTRTNNHTYIVFRLGLVGAYSTQTSQHAVIRMLMALPLLPAAHIVPAFRQLQRLDTTPAVSALLEYVETTWLASSVWSPSTLSVFQQ